jgi:hypothetical protein
MPVSVQHKPEETRLYQIISQHWQTFLQERAEEDRDVPKYVLDEFESYLRCGILAYGFGRLYCPTCGTGSIVAFSCKGRGFCPGCGARRMAEEAIYLRDSLIPCVPVRQFVVTFPPPLRLWLARSTELSTRILATDISTRVNNILIMVGVVFDRGTIETTLNALGVSPRAPPIVPGALPPVAPARVRQERVFDYVDAFYEEQ